MCVCLEGQYKSGRVSADLKQEEGGEQLIRMGGRGDPPYCPAGQQSHVSTNSHTGGFQEIKPQLIDSEFLQFPET